MVQLFKNLVPYYQEVLYILSFVQQNVRFRFPSNVQRKIGQEKYTQESTTFPDTQHRKYLPSTHMQAFSNEISMERERPVWQILLILYFTYITLRIIHSLTYNNAYVQKKLSISSSIRT